jgi:uncharacterized membrane protein YfcA
MSFILFYILTFLCEIIGTIGGFGSSVYFVAIASLFFDFKLVLGITAFMHVFSNLAKLIMFFKHIDYKLILKIGIPSTIFVIIGAYLSSFISFQHFDLVLGIFLILLSITFILFEKFSFEPNNLNSITLGGISGFTAGIMGTGGAIRGLLLISMNLEKSILVATSAGIDMMVDLSRSAIYYSEGYMPNEMWMHLPFLILASFAGTFVGKKILDKIPQEKFKKYVLILIAVIGGVNLVYHFY